AKGVYFRVESLLQEDYKQMVETTKSTPGVKVVK
ncbi:hypothetical protein CCACVL1_25814, partial [Corchorus capsularis]